MRASTVFILALALLIGLGVAAAAKSAGLFKEKPAPPAPSAPLPAKVLVSKVNLFEDITVTADQVYIRELRPEEEKRLQDRYGDNWKDRVMQPLTTAAHMRIPRRNIQADVILLRDDFNEANLPERLTAQLEPNTRAVNVSVPKDKAAGGVVRVGEFVDVFLTTKIAVGDREEIRTACIARGLKVIMKRNIMWTMLATDPDDKPLHFTLQANSYRAALIEYSQTIGQMSLFPVPPPPKIAGTFSDPTSKEYATEDQRVDEVNRGTRTIGTEDLVRIFQIVPPRPVSPPPPPHVVQHLSGVSAAGYTVLPAAGTATVPTAPPGATPAPAPGPGATPDPTAAPRSMGSSNSGVQQASFTFRLPSATGDPNCKSCDEKKRAEADAAKYQTIRVGN